MFEAKMDRIELRRLVIEALEEMSGDSEHLHSDRDDELDEFSGAGAVAGYTMPLGMRPPGPRSNISSIAHRSFGGLPGKRNKRNKR